MSRYKQYRKMKAILYHELSTKHGKCHYTPDKMHVLKLMQYEDTLSGNVGASSFDPVLQSPQRIIGAPSPLFTSFPYGYCAQTMHSPRCTLNPCDHSSQSFLYPRTHCPTMKRSSGSN